MFKWVAGSAVAIIGICIFFWALGFGLEALGLATMPWVENKQTQIVRNTNQYVTSAQTQLLNDITNYDKNQANIAAQSAATPVPTDVIQAEQAQQKDIEQDYCRLYQTLPSNFATPNLIQHAQEFGCGL